MKRILSLFLSLLLLAGLLTPARAEAAALSSKAGIVTTSSTPLNVRKSASTGAQIVSELKKGSYVTLISKSGSWWQVEYANGKYGYCHADYISPVSGTVATVATRSTVLNVRSGPGTNYARTGYLNKGETVIVLSTASGWSRILYHGTKTGYVSAQYLSPQSGSGAASISLNVPSYKQTDSRWAHVTIGASGKTMAQIGCATTAIAMMESYRTGQTITPSAMAKKLSYTSSGSVYWPTHFVAVTNGSGYLSGIYEQLQKGKPVLLGAKNSYGGQHWVVITGFTGGELSPANFTINDPGSSTRTTLQQFLNAYPTFYKYFYY